MISLPVFIEISNNQLTEGNSALPVAPPSRNIFRLATRLDLAFLVHQSIACETREIPWDFLSFSVRLEHLHEVRFETILYVWSDPDTFHGYLHDGNYCIKCNTLQSQNG